MFPSCPGGPVKLLKFRCSLKEKPVIRLTFVIGTPTFETIPTILYSFMGNNFIRTTPLVVALVMMTPNIVMLFIVEHFPKSDLLSASFGKM
jgi:putative spermidine/putrescine transport system permease protein